MGFFLFCCFLAALYVVYRLTPAMSQKWRVRVVKTLDTYSRQSHTVSVVLQRRMTWAEGMYGKNRIVLDNSIRPSDSGFERDLDSAIKLAKVKAEKLNAATKVARKTHKLRRKDTK